MRTFVLMGAGLLAAGCSGPPPPLPMAATPETARPALLAALEAWKAGKAPADLRAQSPPVQFNDADFDRGRRLTEFTLDGDPRPNGTGQRFAVTLTLRDGDRAPVTRKVAYRVSTDPTTSIFREDN
jgi:hypothetical protein